MAGNDMACCNPVELIAGFNTTGADYRRWLREANPRIERLVGPVSMVVGTK